MFNTLFNSLFGKSNDNNFESLDETNNRDNSSEVNQPRSLKEIDSNVTAISLDEDTDWLFVEKEDEREEDDSTSIENSPNNLQLVPYKNLLTHLGCIEEDEENNFFCANLPSFYPNTMDDSWFLTPPECFTSVSSIQLESSPLENLLIEHPSMSVYFNYNSRGLPRPKQSGLEQIMELSKKKDVFEDIMLPVKNRRGKKNNKKNAQPAAPKNVALVLVKSTTAPKTQEQRKPSVGKSAFERNNKCHALRHAPKRTTVINQPTSRMMMISNKKN